MRRWLFGDKGRAPSAQLASIMADLEASARPCVVLRPGSGTSKIGGAPDADVGTDWLCDDGGSPLAVIAQLDLREISEAGGPDWLPQQGLLLFF